MELGALLGATVLLLGAAVAAARARPGSTPRRWVRAAVIALPVIQVATVAVALALVRTADALQQGPTPLLRLALALCTITTVVAAVQVFGTVSAAVDPEKTRTARAIFAGGASGAVVLTWFLAANHLIGRW